MPAPLEVTVAFAAECSPVVLGKPANAFFDAVCDEWFTEDVWVIGDDRGTDVRMGNEHGAYTVQVRTGKHHDQLGRDDLPSAHAVLDSIVDVPELLAMAAS